MLLTPEKYNHDEDATNRHQGKIRCDKLYPKEIAALDEISAV